MKFKVLRVQGKLKGGNIGEFAYRDNVQMIMFHSHGISMQWDHDQVAVEVRLYPEVGINGAVEDGVKIAMHNIGSKGHQSMYFEPEEYSKLLAYFMSLGYPCPDSDPFNLRGTK